MILLSALRPILKLTPVTSSSELIQSSLKSENLLLARDATTVDLRITSGTSVPSPNRQRLLRTQEPHSFRSDHLVQFPNNRVMVASSPLHLDLNHLGASSATRLGTLLEIADRSSPLPWNIRVITGLPHSRIISSSRTTRSSQSLMTWKSLIWKKSQQPQPTDHPDRRRGTLSVSSTISSSEDQHTTSVEA